MPKIQHQITVICRDGTRKKQVLPFESLPKRMTTSNFWIHDGYIYFSGPAIWNDQYFRSEIQRNYVHDVRINHWDIPDWKDEWPRYSNHHFYYDTTVHIFRTKILSQKNNVFRTRNCIISGTK